MLLTPKEAAERIGISPSLIYALIHEGRLPCARIGRRGKRGKILITDADVDALVEDCKAGAAEPTTATDLKHIRPKP